MSKKEKDEAVELTDLSSLDTTGEAEIELYHPGTMEPLGLFVTIVGSDSSEYRKRQKTVAEQKLRRYAQAKSSEDQSAIEKTDWREDGLEVVMACVKSWRQKGGEKGKILWNGEWLGCTEDNVRKVLGQFKWMYEQVDRDIHTRANFLKL